MSFCNNTRNDRTPGPITGNPLNGLCEKACIQAKKVFDACLKQVTLEDYTVTITNLEPPAYTPPLTFISAASTTSKGVISNLTVTPLTEPSRCSRVQCTVTIPIEVLYVDANGVEGRGEGEISVSQDVIMYVPDNSVIPVSFIATVNSVSPNGEFVGNTTECVMTACVTVVLKVVADVDLLVPAYGYCYIPPCNEYTQEACTGVFDLPLFPTTLTQR